MLSAGGREENTFVWPTYQIVVWVTMMCSIPKMEPKNNQLRQPEANSVINIEQKKRGLDVVSVLYILFNLYIMMLMFNCVKYI